MPTSDAVLNPAVALNEVNAEVLAFGLLLAFGFLLRVDTPAP
jgi:hypothetical protein